jgi:hypothetical protein
VLPIRATRHNPPTRDGADLFVYRVIGVDHDVPRRLHGTRAVVTVGVTTGRKENVCVDEAASLMSLSESFRARRSGSALLIGPPPQYEELLPSFDAASRVDALLH